MKLPAMLFRSLKCLLFQSAFLLIALHSLQAQDLQINSLSGSRGGNLVLAVSEDPSSFSRLFASGLPTVMVTDRLSSDLVHINRTTQQIEPSLALRWTADKTGRIYTIHLRRGIRFSDGSPFTADDVLFTFDAIVDPRVGAAMAGQLMIDGVFPTVSKVDDFTLQIAFQKPVGMGLRMLDSIPILPKKHLLQAHREGRLQKACGPTQDPASIVGLGPFRLREYSPGTRIILERNPYYWKKDKSGLQLPYLDSITFLIIKDLNSEALRFRNGELDILSSPSLTPENYGSLRKARKPITLRDMGAGLAIDYMWFNLNPGRHENGKPYVDAEKLALFRNPDFRRAVSHALNRPGMARSVFLGLGAPQYGLVSSGNSEWHNPEISKTEYAPAQARELLARTGLRDSNRDGRMEFGARRQPLEITLLTSRGSTARERLAQIIQSNLREAGIGVSIRFLLQNEIASRFSRTFDYEAMLFGFVPTDAAPDLSANLWYSSGAAHFWHPNQKKPLFAWESVVDSLISRLLTSVDPGIRKDSFNRAQAIWAEHLPAIPTIAPNILVGWSNRLGNVRPSIVPPHLIWNAEELTKSGK